MKVLRSHIDEFRRVVWDVYAAYKRDMPWRWIKDSYGVFVSEIMLQQTQVDRVLKKYPEFMAAFPSVDALAAAPLRDILAVWQGMGYNRRALALKRSAEKIVREFDGRLPARIAELEAFPGIGPATARAIAVFAFNRPVVFIETNIRSVFIHHFFQGASGVNDADILPLVEASLDRDKPREWYYALMDYGVMLKKALPNPNRRSAHYRRQGRFEGSSRQARGRILRVLTGRKKMTADTLLRECGCDSARGKKIIHDLIQEGMVREHKGVYLL